MLRNEHIKILIGICGNAGHGKDTVGRMIANKLERCYVTSFAGPLKQAAMVLFGINPHTTDKDAINPTTGLSIRRAWQLLGTEALRNTFGDNIHTKIADTDIGRIKLPNVIFTDVRFENEADYIIENYGILIHVVNPRKPVLSYHVSEKFAYQFKGYKKLTTHKEQIRWVWNDKTLEDLAREVSELVFPTRAEIAAAQETKKQQLDEASEDYKRRVELAAKILPEIFTESDKVDSEEIKRMYSALKK